MYEVWITDSMYGNIHVHVGTISLEPPLRHYATCKLVSRLMAVNRVFVLSNCAVACSVVWKPL